MMYIYAMKLEERPPKDVMFKVRMTEEERKMLRSLAVRSPYSTDSGFVRALIREAWFKAQARKLGRTR